MVNLNATTPQLTVVKKWMEGYHSLDMKNVEPYTSKSFHYQSVFDAPKEHKDEHFPRYEEVLGSFTKLDTDIHEVIEAPGKVVIHVTTKCSTAKGATKEKDSVCIFTLAEEDGELKITEAKEFSDPQKQDTWHRTTI